MRLFKVILLGFMAGVLHRLLFSPHIGRMRHSTQSVGTPSVGVLLSFPVFITSFRGLLLMTLPPGGERDRVVPVALITAAYAYVGTFLGYGTAVVAMIVSGIGGVKKS